MLSNLWHSNFSLLSSHFMYLFFNSSLVTWHTFWTSQIVQMEAFLPKQTGIEGAAGYHLEWVNTFQWCYLCSENLYLMQPQSIVYLLTVSSHFFSTSKKNEIYKTKNIMSCYFFHWNLFYILSFFFLLWFTRFFY